MVAKRPESIHLRKPIHALEGPIGKMLPTDWVVQDLRSIRESGVIGSFSRSNGAVNDQVLSVR